MSNLPSENVFGLTPMQLEIFKRLALGLTVKEIAAEMGRTRMGIESHKYRIMKRVGVSCRTEVVLAAISSGVVTVDDLPVRSTAEPDTLSERQLEIAKALAAGETRTDLARRLGRSRKAIESHYCRVLARLKLSSAIDLTHYGLQHGWGVVDGFSSEGPECPDCGGTGQYVGLTITEACDRCTGSGRIRKAG